MDEQTKLKEIKEIKEAVERGALLLDQRRPGWAGEINIHRLDLDDDEWCVLGQLYGHFTEGIAQLFPNRSSSNEETVYYGFDTYIPSNCDLMTSQWKKESFNRQTFTQ